MVAFRLLPALSMRREVRIAFALMVSTLHLLVCPLDQLRFEKQKAYAICSTTLFLISDRVVEQF